MKKLMKLLSVILSLIMVFSLFTVTVSADVGDYEFTERESNNTMSLADRIYNDYTVSGSVSGSDMDYFKFTLSAQSEIYIITVADYKSVFLAGVFNSSEEAVAVSTFVEYSDSGYPTYLTSATLSAGTYYYVLFNKDASTLRNDYLFYFTYTTSSTSHTHTYTNSCDTACNGCGDTRQITHIYDSPLDDECNICYEKREVSTEPTLFKAADGKWYYYVNGERSYDTTLIKYQGKWFYIQKGVWDSSVTALVKYSGKWFYIKNGKWDSTDTSLVKYNGAWFYVKNGKWANSTTTIYQKGGKYFYIKDGKWNSGITGFVKYGNYKYYVKSGVVQKSKTDVVKVGGKYYYIKKGILQTGATGVKTVGSKKYYLKKGILQTSVNGIKKVGSYTYYFKKGIASASGIIKSGSKQYYVKSGVVQTSKNGLVSYNSKWYYVKKGVVDTKYNGTAKYKGVNFTVKKGIATAERWHSCSYKAATCTTPKTCIYCFETRGSALSHEFVNSNCVLCNKYIKIPFTVSYEKTLYYYDTAFTIDQYSIKDVDRFGEGFARIYVSITNKTGGYSFLHINFYDKNGLILKTATLSGSKNKGQTEVEDTYIPKGTAKIVITRAD